MQSDSCNCGAYVIAMAWTVAECEFLNRITEPSIKCSLISLSNEFIIEVRKFAYICAAAFSSYDEI